MPYRRFAAAERRGEEAEVARGRTSEIDAPTAEDAQAVARREQLVEAPSERFVSQQRARLGAERGPSR
jgi:hypothetical protein